MVEQEVMKGWIVIGLILMKKHHLQYKQERLDMDADPANQMAPLVIRVEGG